MSVAPAPKRARGATRLPRELDRRFEAIVFDWDGTAVPDRKADASELPAAIEALCALGMDSYVVTGIHAGNQLFPKGPAKLAARIGGIPKPKGCI